MSKTIDTTADARFDEGEQAGKHAWANGLPCQVSAYGDGFEGDENFCTGFRFGWMGAENKQREARGEHPVGFMPQFLRAR